MRPWPGRDQRSTDSGYGPDERESRGKGFDRGGTPDRSRRLEPSQLNASVSLP